MQQSCGTHGCARSLCVLRLTAFLRDDIFGLCQLQVLCTLRLYPLMELDDVAYA